MIQVLLVEDEKLMVQGFLHAIDWEKHGYCIGATAYSAEKALEVCETFPPDVAILDINLPQMNGLELGSILKQKFPTLKIIFLTAYADFSFARNALTLGAERYLLKGETEFEDLLVAMNALTSYLTTPSLSSALNDVLFQQPVALQSLQCLQNILTPSNELLYFPLYITQSPHSHTPINVQAIYDLLIQTLNFPYIATILDHQSLCILVQAFTSQEVILKLSPLTTLCPHLNIGIGTGTALLSKIKEDYIKAKEAIAKAFYEDIPFYIYQNQDETFFNYSTLRRTLFLRLKNGEWSFFFKDLEELLQIFQAQSVPKESVVHTLTEIYTTLLKLSADSASKSTLSSFEMYYKLLSFNTFQSLSSFFNHTVTPLTQCLFVYSKYDKEIINQVVYYLQEHFAEQDLSLHKVANELHINYAYLSSLFNIYLDTSFNNYINTLRINYAKTLIQSHNLKTINISESVGYNTPSYFIKIFKKYVGVTPSEFKKTIRNGE